MLVGWQSDQTGLVGGRAGRWLDYNAAVLVVATAPVPPQHRIRQITADQILNPIDIALKLFDRGVPIAIRPSMMVLLFLVGLQYVIVLLLAKLLPSEIRRYFIICDFFEDAAAPSPQYEAICAPAVVLVKMKNLGVATAGRAIASHCPRRLVMVLEGKALAVIDRDVLVRDVIVACEVVVVVAGCILVEAALLLDVDAAVHQGLLKVAPVEARQLGAVVKLEAGGLSCGHWRDVRNTVDGLAIAT